MSDPQKRGQLDYTNLEHYFDVFVQQQRNFIYHVALQMLRNQDDAEDVTQEVLFKAYTHLAHFRQQASFSTWIYRITINSALDAQNRIARQQQLIATQSCTCHKQPSHEVALESHNRQKNFEPESYFLQLEQRALIDNILAEIGHEKAQLLLLHYVAHMSYQEVASLLGIKLSAVKMRMLRARSDFQKRFYQYEARAVS